MRKSYMSCPAQSNQERDLLCRGVFVFLVYVIPAAALVLAGHLDLSAGWRTVIWAGSLSIMGIGCVANAVRCGRTHCYLTGPFFLLAALATALYGLGVLPLGSDGWDLIGQVVLIGALVLGCLPELLLGKYRKGSESGPRRI
jgi:hypothetical protein